MEQALTSNSYRLRKIQKKRKKRRLIFLIILILIVIIVVAYEIIFSSVFQIQKINVSQTSFVNQNNIIQKINNIFNNKKIFSLISLPPNLLFFNFNDCQSLKQIFFPIESIECQKNFKDKSININIKERIIEGKFCSGLELENENCFYFDKNGILFLAAPQEEAISFLIKETSDKKYLLGDKIMDNFSLVLQIKDFLSEKISLPQIEINNRDIIYSFDNNFQIFISQDKLKETMEILPYIWNDSILLENLQYWDLRFLPKIYYK